MCMTTGVQVDDSTFSILPLKTSKACLIRGSFRNSSGSMGTFGAVCEGSLLPFESFGSFVLEDVCSFVSVGSGGFSSGLI